MAGGSRLCGSNSKHQEPTVGLACSVPCDGARVPGRKKTGKRGIEDELRNIAGELDHRGLEIITSHTKVVILSGV